MSGNGKKNGKQDPTRVVQRPQDWDKAVSAAYLVTLNHKLGDVANSVGIDTVTLWTWRNSDWWVIAEQEAMARWLHGLRAKAMDGLEASVKRSGDLALRVVERMIPELAPAPQRHDHRILGLVAILAGLPPEEIGRLEELPDDELSEEIDRLVGAGG